MTGSKPESSGARTDHSANRIATIAHYDRLLCSDLKTLYGFIFQISPSSYEPSKILGILLQAKFTLDI